MLLYGIILLTQNLTWRKINLSLVEGTITRGFFTHNQTHVQTNARAFKDCPEGPLENRQIIFTRSFIQWIKASLLCWDLGIQLRMRQTNPCPHRLHLLVQKTHHQRENEQIADCHEGRSAISNS